LHFPSLVLATLFSTFLCLIACGVWRGCRDGTCSGPVTSPA
jgi:hypothetical protein